MTISYDQAFNKLDSICESAFIDCEVAILTEEAEATGNDVKKSNKLKTGIKLIWAAIKKMIKLVKTAIANLVARVKYHNVKGAVAVTAGTLYAVSSTEGINDLKKTYDALIGWCEKALKGEADATSDPIDNRLKCLDEVNAESKQTVDSQALLGALLYINKACARLDSFADKAHAKGNYEVERRIKDMVSDFSRYTTCITKMFAAHNEALAQDIKNKKAKLKKDVKKIKDGEAEAKNESASRVERMAQLLIEAASLLEEADEPAVTDAAVAETMPAEEAQKEPEELPEEPAVKAEEYPEEVSGGEGEKVDLEEVKDLVGDDEEAIALMTDEDTTGSQVCDESVTIEFGW